MPLVWINGNGQSRVLMSSELSFTLQGKSGTQLAWKKAHSASSWDW